jgi:hypothetical protein
MIRKGRFKKPAAEIAQRYGESVSFGFRLFSIVMLRKILAFAARWQKKCAIGAASAENTAAQIMRWRSNLVT